VLGAERTEALARLRPHAGFVVLPESDPHGPLAFNLAPEAYSPPVPHGPGSRERPDT